MWHIFIRILFRVSDLPCVYFFDPTFIWEHTVYFHSFVNFSIILLLSMSNYFYCDENLQHFWINVLILSVFFFCRVLKRLSLIRFAYIFIVFMIGWIHKYLYSVILDTFISKLHYIVHDTKFIYTYTISLKKRGQSYSSLIHLSINFYSITHIIWDKFDE